MKKGRNLQSYKELLPVRINVEIHRTKDGFWAKIKELSHCYTQAKNFIELIDMVNDAVYTYLEIPVKLKSELGYYLPGGLIKIFEEFHRQEQKRGEWQRVIQEIINKNRLKKKTEVFQLESV